MTFRELLRRGKPAAPLAEEVKPKPDKYQGTISIRITHNGDHEWSVQAQTVPRIGEWVTLDGGPDRNYTVSHVGHYFVDGKHYVAVHIETHQDRLDKIMHRTTVTPKGN